jgi:hypothetical protein
LDENKMDEGAQDLDEKKIDEGAQNLDEKHWPGSGQKMKLWNGINLERRKLDKTWREEEDAGT